MSDRAFQKFKDTPGACPTCWGSGKIANDDDQSPWPVWRDMEPPSNMAVTMGLVFPIKCPSCKGTGMVPPEGPVGKS